jgi:hypothetical protein
MPHPVPEPHLLCVEMRIYISHISKSKAKTLFAGEGPSQSHALGGRTLDMQASGMYMRGWPIKRQETKENRTDLEGVRRDGFVQVRYWLRPAQGSVARGLGSGAKDLQQ